MRGYTGKTTMKNYKLKETLFAGHDFINGLLATVEVRVSDDMTFTLSVSNYLVQVWDEESKKDYTEYYIDNCSSDVVIAWLKEWDCSYSELAEYIMDDIQRNSNFYDHPYRLCDVLVDEDGDEYALENVCGGQHDIREDNLTFTSQAITELLEIWDKYHLKTIDEDTYCHIKDLIATVENDTDKQDITLSKMFYKHCKEVIGAEGLK